MKKILTLILALAAAASANLDRFVNCGAMTALPPLSASAIVCPVPTTKQGVATDDTVLFKKSVNGATNEAYFTSNFTSVGGKDSIICYITGQRRESDDGSVIYQMLYQFPGQSTWTAIGGNDTLTYGATVSTQRTRRPLLPGVPFTPIAYVSTATDTLGILAGYCFNK